MVECAICGNKIEEEKDISILEVSDAAERAVANQYDFRIEQSLDICTGCIIEIVVDYLYTTKN